MHITEKQLKFITEIASKEAIKAHYEKKELDRKKRHDRRLRNIKLLLRNYRSFKKNCDDVKLEIDDINQRIGLVAVDSKEFKLESIKRSKEKTLIMVRYTEKMMQVYEILCMQDEDPEEMRRYNVVHDLYVSDKKESVKDIAERYSVAERTVYRDIDKASESLAILMFGIDGVKFK